MRRVRRILGIIFFGVLMRDLVRASLLILLGVILTQEMPDVLHLFLASISILSTSIYANIENDIADIELDRKVKAYRPLPSGKYTVQEARRASMVFLFVSFISGLVASAAARNLALCMVLLSVPLATHLYSSPPVRLKSRSWPGVVTLSLIYLSPLLTGYVLAEGGYENVPILLLLFLVFFLATGAKDFEDVDVDGSFQVLTPPVRYGIGRAAACLQWVSVLLVASAAGLTVAYLLSNLGAQALYCLFVLPSALVYLKRLMRYSSSRLTTDLMRLVKGNLWTMFAWPTVAGIIIFLGVAILG